MLQRFRKFVIEAAFSAGAQSKVVRNIEKLLAKRLGTKLYRYGGKDGVQELVGKTGKALGFQYFIGSGTRAFRLNMTKTKKSLEITSVNVWNKYKFDSAPSYTIELNGLNIVQVIDKVAEGIKTGKLSESLEEAKRRVSVQVFSRAAQTILGRYTNLSRSDIKKVSDSASINIPGGQAFFKSNPGSKRGKFDLPDPESVADAQAKAMGGGKRGDVILGDVLTIVTRDGKSGRFKHTDIDHAASEMEKQIHPYMKEMDAAKPSKIEYENPDTLFGQMADLVEIVATGGQKSLIIFGRAGVGKTYVTTQTLKKTGVDHKIFNGAKVTAAALYQTLFMHRDGTLLMFDDSDSLIQDKDSVNMLKGALDDSRETEISWLTSRTIKTGLMSDEEKSELNRQIDADLKSGGSEDGKPIKFPDTFIYKGKIIIISNLAEEKFDKAILSRSFKIDMTLTDEQVFQRLESILPNVGDKDASLEMKQEVLQVLREQNALGKLTEPNMRTFVGALLIRMSNKPNWKALLAHV